MLARLILVLTVSFALAAPVAAQDVPSLHAAVLQGDTAGVRAALKAGADPDARDAFGSTPLTIAATFGRDRIASMLLGAGADPNLPGADRSTPLHIAAFFGRERIARALLDRGALKVPRNAFGQTPLETVLDPYDSVAHIYRDYAKGLAPLGFKLDEDTIRAARPRLVELLRPTREELAALGHTPSAGFPISTPDAEGLDPDLIAELYFDAAGVEKLRSVLVLRRDKLIAEGYFNGARSDEPARIASVTKSITGALVGIALERADLSSVDQPMLEFFPELGGHVTDPRKQDITVRHLLQMRSGFPWEETDPKLWAGLLTGHYVPRIEDEPLVNDPSDGFNYSNMSSNWLGLILARSTGADLDAYARETLFAPLGIEPGDWDRDADGNVIGCANLRLTPRDLARFGLCMLNDGRFDGKQVIPSEWVEASLTDYSPDAWITKDRSSRVGRYFKDLGYGYQWWSATAGEHEFDFAWGHGGQLVVLLHDLDMVIVATTNFEFLKHDDEAWSYEIATLNLIGKFIASLPAE